MSKKLNFETTLLEYGEVNSGFARVKVSVMTHEQVANNTKFNKENITKRASGLNYLPVVGEFKKEDGDFGTHGGKLEISDDGWDYVDTTKPYGVVIADSWRWEDVKLKNGEYTEYLVCDAFLWIDRYEELNCLYEGKLNNQSMEIKVLDGKFNEDTWVYDVSDFEFSALCILGTEVSPAFNEAKVDINFQKEDFKLNYNEMMSALDTYLSNNEQSVVIENMTQVEDAKFEDQIVDTQEEKFEEADTEEQVTEEEEVQAEDVEESEEVETETDEETEEETDTESKEEQEDFSDEQTEDQQADVDYMKLHNELAEKFNLLTQEVDELREYKQNKESAELKAVKMTKINSFANRIAEEDLKPLVDNLDKFTAEELEVQCFAIMGRKKMEEAVNQLETIGNTHAFTKVGNLGANHASGDWLSLMAK